MEVIDYYIGPQTYLMKIRGQDHYKIGFSKNVKRRKKEILGNSPYHLDIIETISSPLAKRLEEEIRSHFKKFISAQEWITLDPWAASVLKSVFELYRCEFTDCLLHHKAPDIFYVIIEDLKTLILNHTYNTLPTEQDIFKLKILYSLISNLSPIKLEHQSEIAISSKIKRLHYQIDELHKELINNFCDIKINDTISGKAGNKYIVQEIDVHIDYNNYNSKPHYFYKGKRLLKNGRVGKASQYVLVE